MKSKKQLIKELQKMEKILYEKDSYKQIKERWEIFNEILFDDDYSMYEQEDGDKNKITKIKEGKR